MADGPFGIMRRRLEDVVDDDDDLISSTDSAILLETMRVFGSLYLVSVLGYSFARRRYPRYFNIRSWSEEHKTHLADKQYKLFSWIWESFQVSDEDILIECGMDALCFLRALRFGRKMAVVGCFNALWLIPLYATAPDAPETDYITDGLTMITTSNLPFSSKRFFGTVIAAYIIFIYSMYLIFYEYEWYTRWRHQYLSLPLPRNYAVYVAGIPYGYRSSYELASYFRSCSSSAAVLEAHVSMDIPQLEAKVARRELLVKKLEHAIALEQRSGETQTHRSLNLRKGVEKIETVTDYESQLETLNREISRSVREIRATNDRFRSKLNRMEATVRLSFDDEAPEAQDADDDMDSQDLKILPILQREQSAHLATEDTLKTSGTHSLVSVPEDGESGIHDVENPSSESLESSFVLTDSNAVAELIREEGAPSSAESSDEDKTSEKKMSRFEAAMHDSSQSNDSTGRRMSSIPGTIVQSGFEIVTTTGNTLAKGSRKAGKRISQTAKVAGDSIAKGSRQAVGSVISNATEHGTQAIKVAKHVGTNIITSAGAVVPLLVAHAEGKPRNAGFVVFSDLYTTQTALQMIHHPKPYTMDVQEAPNPKDIFWRNVGMPYHARRTGIGMAFGATVILCFFWSIPMAFIVSLTEVNSLKETLPRLGDLVDGHPRIELVLAQSAPILLLIANEVVLPEFLRYFATWEGHISSAMLEASLFLKLGCFMIIQTFFVSAVTGTITAELSNMIDEPGRIIDFLAASLPAQSSYFMQIVLASTFLLQSLELGRIYPLGVAFLRRFFGPRLTAKERRRRWGWLRCLEDPPDFWHAETFAQLILYYMILYVYISTAPLTAFVLAFCFGCLEFGYRHQFIHNYPRAFDTGGRLWKYFIHFTLSAMVVAQLTLVGMLSLKQSKLATPTLAPLLVMTILFILFINAKHSIVSNYLPTRECLLVDKPAAEEKRDVGFVKGQYLQPALQNKPVEVDYDPE